MSGDLRPQRGQTWRFSRQVWLYLSSVFAFGLSQAFTALFHGGASEDTRA